MGWVGLSLGNGLVELVRAYLWMIRLSLLVVASLWNYDGMGVICLSLGGWMMRETCSGAEVDVV